MDTSVSTQNIFTIAILCFLFTGCSKPSIQPNIPVLDPSELRSAPEQVEIGGFVFRLEAGPWRDMMPGQTDRPLYVEVKVIETEGRPIQNVGVNFVWVLKGDMIWSSLFSDEDRPPTPDYEIEKVARGGPTWNCGDVVEVVVGLSHPDDELILLRSSQQRIECAY